MNSVSLTGEDVMVIAGRVMNDVADGDWASVEFDGDLAKAKISKDGNMIYALDTTGQLAKVTVRLLGGSSDDVFLNALLQQMLNDFSAFNLLTGSLTKRVGDGAGNISRISYQVVGGIFKKWPMGKSNAEGDTAQSVAIYEMLFKNQSRAIQ